MSVQVVKSPYGYRPMGDLAAYIDNFVAKFSYGLREDSSSKKPYLAPSFLQRFAMAEAFEFLLKGDLTVAQKTIDKAGIKYRVLAQFAPGIGRIGRILFVLREAPGTDTPHRWGRYFFSPQASTDITIEVPHPRFDENSEDMGIEAFRYLDARCFFIAGTGRWVNETKVEKDSKEKEPTTIGGKINRKHFAEADVAHQPDSIFHSLHYVVANTLGGAFVQYHAFDESEHPDRPDNANVVVTGGAAGETALAKSVAAKLNATALTPTAVRAITSYKPLNANLNEQGAVCKDKKLDFIHVEVGDSLRKDMSEHLQLARVIADAVRDGRDSVLARLRRPVLGFDRMEYPHHKHIPSSPPDMVVDPDQLTPDSFLPDFDNPGWRIRDENDLMRQWSAASPFSFCGYYLDGGKDDKVPGYPPTWFTSESRSWRGKRKRLVEMGWRLLPIYYGRQNKSEILNKDTGAKDAEQAHRIAQQEEFPYGTTIYLDIEDGTPLWKVGAEEARTDGMVDYVHAWLDWFATHKNTNGYKPGVYCSYLVADSVRKSPSGAIRSNVDFWVYNVACSVTNEPAKRSPGCTVTMAVPPQPSESGFKYATVWQYAKSSGTPGVRDEDATGCRDTSSGGPGYQPATASGADAGQCLAGPFGVTLLYTAEVDLNVGNFPLVVKRLDRPIPPLFAMGLLALGGMALGILLRPRRSP